MDILTKSEDMVERTPGRILLKAKAARGIALGIAVNEERSLVEEGEGSSQVYGSRCLSDSALLVGDTDDFRHCPLSKRKFIRM